MFAAALMASAGAAFAQSDSDIVREGEGPRRKDLDAMELKAFPDTAWSYLSDFKNGAAITAGSTAGKPVLIVTWADWYAPSKRAMSQAQRLAEKYGKDGLVVVAVHDAEGWGEAKKPASADGSLLLAFDAKGEFRQALKVDQDPDFYVIDRAGQLRFADVSSDAVERAVDVVVKESADAAGGINQKLAEEKLRAEIERRRTQAIRERVDLTTLPEIPFEAPSPQAYKDAKWPKMPRDPNAPEPDPNAEPAATVINIPESGWFPDKPELAGRAIMLYFWHPEIPESYQQIIPAADRLQKQYGRDLVIIGVLCPIVDQNGQERKVDNDPEKLQKRIEEFNKSRTITHWLVKDLSGGILGQVRGTNSGPMYVPYIALLSSDKTLRWSGFAGLASYASARDMVLSNDPGIQARRRAENEYLKGQK